MERRTVTLKWDHLDEFDDDDDDEFFESTNRMSVVVPLDMTLSELDDDDNDQEFNDPRVSFSQNLPSNLIREPQKAMVVNPASTSQYDMWMVAPGSITDRRRKLLQGMGLNSNKDFARLSSTTNNKLSKASPKILVSTKPAVTSLDTNIINDKTKAGSVVKDSSPRLKASEQVKHKQSESQPQAQTQAKAQAQSEPQEHAKAEPQPQPQVISQPNQQPESQPESEPQPQSQPQAQDQYQAQAQTSTLPLLLIRSRSDSDIETSSFNTKRRKQELIGLISKQCLTRTSSEMVAASVGLSCQYANILRVYNPSNEQRRNSSTSTTKIKNNANNASSSAQLDSFFLIKNLDTGKEFVVKEFNDEGMWNKVNDLQTGKQLTMDEFEKTVGHSPVVKELMRRTSHKKGNANSKFAMTNSYVSKSFRYSKKKGAAILKNIKGSMRISRTEKEKDDSVTANTSSASSSQTNEAQKAKGDQTTKGDQKTKGEQKMKGDQNTNEDKKANGEQKMSGEPKTSTNKNSNSEWVKAKAHGKPLKEFSALHQCQEIQAHDGSIWTMKFNFDGHYLASGGEDKVIRVWEVQECDVMSMRSGDDNKGLSTPENRPPLPDNSVTTSDKKKRSKNNKKKSGVPEYVKVPEIMFGLSEKPVCTLEGHQDDILDLSWSKSQLLLSSSMDKTVRLWDVETKNCLKQFAHSDYVTCIQFNPKDENYFISGSLDKKVRIWSIPSRKVVDWSDLHDMLTAICYYPDGEGAIVGLHKGDCKSYNTTDCKLEQKDQIELHTKPKADPKKITGFQFSPSNPSEVLVTSADSRVRILDGSHVIDKLIGYKNTSSQFIAQYSTDGNYIVCASEDSQVYIWKHEKPKNNGAAKPKYVTTTSYEHFSCTEVTVALPWQGSGKRSGPLPVDNNGKTKKSKLPPVPKKDTEKGTNEDSEEPSNSDTGASESGDGSLQSDRGNNTTAAGNNNVQSTAWGLVIVTAGVGGEIKVYQNVGLPVKVGYQTNLF
uniref:WD repeat-containing protein 44 n=1 Tax=Erigeron canadensis TaxID=72917 RepID=UPI001CB9328A|nr:WD repeat-containing protein 44 [Erigeron canadensis]